MKKYNINDISNLQLIAKKNYRSKNGIIKKGVEIDGKYYAFKNDL